MDKKAKVTIIMSNYNQEKYIRQAIESVLAQKTNFDWQLIITDDCSTKDNSVEIIKEYVEKYPDKIKALLNKENGRYLKNILRAKAITKSEYFCLLDSDDYWTDENYLQDAVNFLDANQDYVIYSRNVLCQTEDGREYLFVSKKIPKSDFTLEDYFKHTISITQTTGSFFRNVIFKDGIPEIMTNAIGTVSERSFEGDFDRYIMHLKYGKAHYEPKPSGVYRILSTGIWSKLSNFEKHLLQAQSFFDYNRFFDSLYEDFFFSLIYKELNLCLLELDKFCINFDIMNDSSKQSFFNLYNECFLNKDLIKNYVNSKKRYNVIDSLLLLIYKYCRKKIAKRGLF